MALTKIKLNTMVTGTLPDANIPDTITIDNAATATALETARTIHGVSFDGTANIDLTEAIQDVVGGMVASNTETNISVTYDDTNGKLDFASTDTTYSVGDGGLTQNNFTDALKTKLDGIASSANNYSLPLATSSTRGGVKIGYTESGKNYPVELDSEKMYVNVPWTDTNTTYSVGDGGLTQNNFTDALKSKLDGIESGATADQTKADIDALNINADLLDGQHGSYYQPASSAITTSNIGSQSVSSATSAVRLNGFDNRTISPSEFGNTRVRFGFTSWGNNNSSPYADAFHLSSYSDSSGGAANLVMFKKSGIGMRIWQQSFNSSTAYSSYADVMLNTGGTFSGHVNITYDSGVTGASAPTYTQTNLEVQTSNNNVPAISFHRGGYSATTLYEEGGELYINAWVSKPQDGKIITSGNLPDYVGNWADSSRNFHLKSPTNTNGQGLLGKRNDGTFQYQIYGDGSAYGFLDGAFAGWDLRKFANGGLVLYGSGNNETQIGSDDEWGRLQFSNHSNGSYIYLNTGSFRVDNGHWATYDDGEIDLGGGQTTQRWRNLYLQSQIVGGFGGMTTGGSSNWNDNSNARSGAGYTLLLGNASNGPSGTGDYFHSHSYEYGSSGGSNNMTQFAIPYIVTAGGGMYMRSRYQNNWSGWVKFYDSNNMYGIARTSNTYGSFNVTNGGNSWAGITYGSHSSKPTIMFKDNHGDGGLYHQGSSSWRLYYDQNNSCMGINGSTTNSSYGLYVTGSTYTTGSYGSSDIRFKKNIETIDNGLDKVMKMRGVYFDWNDEHKAEKGESRQVGVIAQEIKMVLPEVVVHQDNDEYAVDYSKITGVLIEAIKDLKNEINELKKGCCNGSCKSN